MEELDNTMIGRGRDAIDMIIDQDSLQENIIADYSFDPEYGTGAVVGTIKLDGRAATVIANDAQTYSDRFPVVFGGIIGLEEGYKMATAVYRTLAADADKPMDEKRPIVLIVDTPGNGPGKMEEIAGMNKSTGSYQLALAEARKAGHPIVAIVIGRAISGAFLCHAGNDPKRGRSAILEMAHKVIDIQNLTNWDKGYTFNVGTINGGTIFNAVPGVCEIDVDIRYLDPNVVPEIKEKIDEIVGKTYIEGTRTELVDFHVGISAMQTTDGVKKLFKLLAETSEENGFGKATDKLVGGGSDSAYTVIAGVPTVCSVGVKGANNHAPEEYAVVESMFERAKLIIATVLKLKEFE